MAQRSRVGYEFAQPPAAVPHKRRAPYRDPLMPPPMESPANIMFDKRVVRGNTYAAQVLPPSAQAEAERRQIEAEQRARRRELEGQTRRDHLDIPRTPSPVDGRRHIDVQTENYLEELSDRVPEVEEATQTEAFMDRPPSPLFIPTKTGLDKETQILPGDLFDFDLEVEPILEVLVGKTLEQGLMEVLEEEELENIRKHQEEFEQIRNAELAEVQRLEEEVKRKDAEKKRRLNQERARVKAEKELREKVAARAFVSNYLTNLQKNAFSSLVHEGHFFDPLTAEVEEKFMPWLLGRVETRLGAENTARAAASDVLRHTISVGLERALAAKAQRAEEARLAAEKAAEEKRLRLEAEAAAAQAAAEAAAKGEGEDDE